MTWDQITDSRILSLNSKLQPIAVNFINYFEKQYNILMRITCGFRDNITQHEYYTQGRTKAGKIITFADSGMSFHNYGLAFDCCRIENRKSTFNVPFPYLKDASLKFKLKWGGDFSFHDYFHFQMSFGHPISYYYNGGMI